MSVPVMAGSVKLHESTAEELLNLQKSPDYFSPRFYSEAPPDWRPTVDTSDYKYVLLSSETQGTESANLRRIIAKNLPAGVKLVLLVSNSGLAAVKAEYAKYISLDRVIFATAPDTSNGFWGRDAYPNSVVDSTGKVSLVSAKYYRDFRAGAYLARAVNFSMTNHTFTFVGGNLMADENGNCFTIDSYRRYNSTDEDLKNAYGCRTVHVMRHAEGIGDVDEVIKTLGNNTILTNVPAYEAELKSWGYKVVMLPGLPGTYRTYANSMIIGKAVFMPTYGVPTDAVAQKVYESLGYTVFGIPSNYMSDVMHGSVHCQTMAYPDMPEKDLLSQLGLNKIQE